MAYHGSDRGLERYLELGAFCFLGMNSFFRKNLYCIKCTVVPFVLDGQGFD